SGWEQVYTTGFRPQPADINAPTAADGWLNSGNGTAFTTAQFITWLNNQGAFSNKYWIARCSWYYANNNYIDDTGCGRIDLSGSVIEVFSNKTTSNYTIRVTTTTTSGHGGVNNAEFIYVYNGSDYSPGWRRSYNTRNKPTASDVGALSLSGGALTGGLTAAGEIISKSANGLRIAYGNYGFFIRNDGSSTYFMLTDSGNSLGTYNSLRPLIINNANGAVTIANGLNVTGGINGSLNGNASTATKLQTARKISGVSFDGSSDITLKASHVGAFALGQTGSRVANDKAVGWNWNSGVYDADISGSTALILHFNMNVGSCPAVQFRVNYRNGGIFYRSARDGYGFEEDWTQIYTKKDSIPGVNTTGNQNTTGNAATATKLQTARKIAGVAFDGSADITLTAANLNAYTKTEVTNLLSSYVKSSALPSMTVRTSSISGGDMGMSLSTFISHLKSNGAFSKRYWIGFGDAMGFNAGSINNITGFGAVELAESIIEVFNLPNGDYTIRLTTSHKADYGGVTNAILVYHYRSNRSPSGQWLKFAGTVGATSN
ncbi:TPA: phage tail protein, partial [Escherichia coli]|nr:phage tail protein [Escherichia coli]